MNMYGAAELREAFEKNGNVVAVFSGHSPVNYHTKVNDIDYVVINDLVDKSALGSFADINIQRSGNEVSVSATQLGKKPDTYNFSKTL
jgi:hypothetical protein